MFLIRGHEFRVIPLHGESLRESYRRLFLIAQPCRAVTDGDRCMRWSVQVFLRLQRILKLQIFVSGVPSQRVRCATIFFGRANRWRASIGGITQLGPFVWIKATMAGPFPLSILTDKSTRMPIGFGGIWSIWADHEWTVQVMQSKPRGRGWGSLCIHISRPLWCRYWLIRPPGNPWISDIPSLRQRGGLGPERWHDPKDDPFLPR